MGPNRADKPALNEFQKRHLLVSCAYADKLLSDIEEILNSATSKAAFKKYILDVSPVQRKVVDDYIARIRAQLVRVLDGLDAQPFPPRVSATHAVNTTLTFVDIAVEELKPKYMRGYGEIPPEIEPQLDGIALEFQNILRKLQNYLSAGIGKDLQERLRRLETKGGADLELLAKLEEIIDRNGLVEFRTTLSDVLDRVEDNNFEIAFFGRVSSGKSSLLNALLERNILPVGVTPITAVPTRIVLGHDEVLHVSFANRLPQKFEVSRLSEFVSEERNPSNSKHVTRVTLLLRSSLLPEGVSLVDTPGLGSLAASGTAETLAYLPRCDFGVLLIDAGATLTEQDLTTIRSLYDVGVPATVLLSKADLVDPADRERLLTYVQRHIHSELGIEVKPYAVSALPQHLDLLLAWSAQQLRPLLEDSRRLRAASMARKTAALQENVEVALRSLLTRRERKDEAPAELKSIETRLRSFTGEFLSVRRSSEVLIENIGRAAPEIIREAARLYAEELATQENRDSVPRLSQLLAAEIQQRTNRLAATLKNFVEAIHEILFSTARKLSLHDVPSEDELGTMLRDMPAFEFPSTDSLKVSVPVLASMFGNSTIAVVVRRQLSNRIGEQFAAVLAIYARVLGTWLDSVLKQLQRAYDSHADIYRASIERVLGGGFSSASAESIRSDLESLEEKVPQNLGA